LAGFSAFDSVESSEDVRRSMRVANVAARLRSSTFIAVDI